MKKNFFVFFTFLIVFNFLQADSIPNQIFNAVRKMKTGLNCIDACWEESKSPVQLLSCMSKCPRETNCKNSDAVEDKIMCNTEKSVDAIFKCHTANSKNQKAARKCSGDVVTKYLTKNVAEFEKLFSKIGDEIDSIMEYSSFANNGSYSSEVRAASRVIEEDNYHSTTPNTWKNKTVAEIRNYEAVQNNKVATLIENGRRMEEAWRLQAERRRNQQSNSQPQTNYNSGSGNNESYKAASSAACGNAQNLLAACEVGEGHGGGSCDLLRQDANQWCSGSDSSANTNNAPSSPSNNKSDICHCKKTTGGGQERQEYDLGMRERQSCNREYPDENATYWCY